MRIATWNINSVKARLPRLLDWLKTAAPDVALLQETKCPDDAFPAAEIEDLGYNLALHGQRTYNGVAILAKSPIEDVRRGLPGDDSDDHARYIEATVRTVRVCCLYLPNGNPVGTEKFTYKLAWMDRLIGHARELLTLDEAVVLGGDFNVCPEARDVYDPEAFADDALFRPESRAKLRELIHLGLTDAYRARHPQDIGYTFWDYQGRAWPRNHGLRIDHLLLSPLAADRLGACEIDKDPRGKDKPSDHTPIWCELEDRA